MTIIKPIKPFSYHTFLTSNPHSQSPKHPENDYPLPRPVLPLPMTFSISESEACQKASSSCHHREVFLHKILTRVFDHNKEVLKDFPQHCVSITYDAESSRIAKTDVKAKTITFGPRAYSLAQSQDEIAAILCHELSHILLDHKEFDTSPPFFVQQNPNYWVAKKEADDLYSQIPTSKVAAIFRGLDEAQKKLAGAYATAKEEGFSDSFDVFARGSSLEVAKEYVSWKEQEDLYQQKVEKWQKARSKVYETIDFLMGEKGAYRNWREEQADIMGFRLFLAAQFPAKGFFSAIVSTLSHKDRGLSDYAHELFNDKEPEKISPPLRGEKSHPSGRWRIYNLYVREMHLRYPQYYEPYGSFVW